MFGVFFEENVPPVSMQSTFLKFNRLGVQNENKIKWLFPEKKIIFSI